MGPRSLNGAVGAALAASLFATPAPATLIYGDVQLSGNVETQNLLRVGNDFDLLPIQQRNTIRLQYEHQLVKDQKPFSRDATLPWIDDVGVYAYYRGVYDSIYDIEPGGVLRAQDGSRGGRFDLLRGGSRSDLALENVLREAYVDVGTTGPLSFRIGRQQIIWGTALNFRALDQHNSLDLTWHFQQEAGLLGKVGFTELRVPQWTFKTLVNAGRIGPVSNVYLEAYEMPFGFTPTEFRFLPAPWSIPLRNPLRGGLVIDAADVADIPLPGLVLVQPCFDLTGSTETNAEANPDFSDTAETGLCPAAGLKRTSSRTGLYDRHDPAESHQFGARVGGFAPLGIEFTLNYIYRRSPGLGLPGSASTRTQVGVLGGAGVAGFVEPSVHSTTDPITGETSTVQGFVRVPVEFYFPYIHVFGTSLNYFDDFTSSVWNLELTYMKGVPVGTADPTGNAVEKKGMVVGAANIDRPTWIRALNRRSTFTAIAQLNFVWSPEHDDLRYDATGALVDGDVGTPSSKLIPGLYGDENRIDQIQPIELLSLFVLTTFYRGGTIAPLFAWISDWGNAPSMEFLFLLDYYPTNNIVIEPGVRIFTNFGRNVDDPFGIGRLSEWDEVQLKVTYQF